MTDHAALRFAIVPFAVGTGGYMGQEAVRLVNRLGDMLCAQAMRYKAVSQGQC